MFLDEKYIYSGRGRYMGEKWSVDLKEMIDHKNKLKTISIENILISCIIDFFLCEIYNNYCLIQL